MYCLTYALTCLTMFSDNFTVLFLGRLCGGVSTTLLFSVFEAWMITEYHRRGLDGSTELTLSTVFGNMTTLSCVVAIVCGVVGDVLVSVLGGRVWPFVASIVCSGLAAYFIVKTWVSLPTPLLPLPSFHLGNDKQNTREMSSRPVTDRLYSARTTAPSPSTATRSRTSRVA